MFHLVVQTRYNQWQHGDRFSAALRLQTGTCAKRLARWKYCNERHGHDIQRAFLGGGWLEL